MKINENPMKINENQWKINENQWKINENQWKTNEKPMIWAKFWKFKPRTCGTCRYGRYVNLGVRLLGSFSFLLLVFAPPGAFPKCQTEVAHSLRFLVVTVYVQCMYGVALNHEKHEISRFERSGWRVWRPVLVLTFGLGVPLGALEPPRNIQPRRRMSSLPIIEIYCV